MTKFSENLVAIREAKGLTQEKMVLWLAERGLRITRTRLKSWELGERMPGAYVLIRLCDVLDIVDIRSFVNHHIVTLSDNQS
ncbi:MAG TPA: helix-turn-helix transcriptional regulator [Chryseolinea sp.]|nr:helix-turn-helix transcriptional regulator [Chryseolinea sp.]